MTKKVTTITEMNMTIVALVAVVAIVGLVALVMNAAPTHSLNQGFSGQETTMLLGEYELVEDRGDELVLKRPGRTTYSSQDEPAEAEFRKNVRTQQQQKNLRALATHSSAE